MVTLDTASKLVSYMPATGSQRPDSEEWIGWAFESPAPNEAETAEQSSPIYPFGLGHSSLEAYGRMAHLVRLQSLVGVHFSAETRGRSITGDYGGYLDTQRRDLKQEVYELLIDAGADNWDGEGALALQQDTVVAAQELIGCLPPYIGDPDVAATPHGEVDFDWVIDREVMLTVSVGPSKEVAFAGLFYGARLNGCEPWTGVLPRFVQCCFERLREAQNT